MFLDVQLFRDPFPAPKQIQLLIEFILSEMNNTFMASNCLLRLTETWQAMKRTPSLVMEMLQVSLNSNCDVVPKDFTAKN